MKLTNEQIEMRIARRGAELLLHENAATRLKNEIAELGAQRQEEPEDLYMAVDKDGFGTRTKSLAETRNLILPPEFAPYTLYKLTPANDDGSEQVAHSLAKESDKLGVLS